MGALIRSGRLLRNFRADRRGNIAITFAISLLPVLAALGCAIDYSLANSAYAKLQACADSAVVAAVSQQGMTQSAGEAQTAMVNWFNGVCAASVSSLSQVTISNVSAKATDSGAARSAVLTFTASRSNDFLRIAGFPTTQIDGSAKAASAQQTYLDIYALMDDSPSMGLAATSADQAKLMSLTSGNCQFGCHETGPSANSPDNYTIAKNNSVQMRIDVLRSSWIGLINQAYNASGANAFRFATYTFDTSLNVRQALTGSVATALASAANIDLQTADPSADSAPSTYTDTALQAMVTNIPSSGDGSSVANSKKYLIFVTDGLQDMYNCGVAYCRQLSAVTTSNCTALKNKGINLAVIYTTYLPMNNVPYNVLVAPMASTIAPALQSCASPGLYFEAADASAIGAAFNTIFVNVLTTAKLTN